MPGTTKDCPLDPYTIMHDRSRFVDQQSIKLQEAPDVVPVGELPRHMQLSAERSVHLRLLSPVPAEADSESLFSQVLDGQGCARIKSDRHGYLLDVPVKEGGQSALPSSLRHDHFSR